MPRIYRNENGNVALIFAIAALALTLSVGGAIDIARMQGLHSTLQTAADAAALTAARFTGIDPAQRKSQADGSYLANMADFSGATVGTLTSQGETWTYSASHPIETTFLKVIGLTSVTMEATASATNTSDTLDVALVLDNSGSMSTNNRMVELKKAVKLFLGSFTSGGDVQVALVPFDSQVKVDNTALTTSTSNAPANPFAATTDCSTLVDANDKTACTAAQTAKPTINCNTFATSAPYYVVSQNRCNASYNSGGFKAGTAAIYVDCVGWDLLHILCLNYANLNYNTTDTGSAVVLTRQEWGCTQYLLLLCTAWGWTNNVTLETKPYTPNPATTPQTSKTASDETANANLLLQPADVWSGCLIDRTQPYDTQNDPPIAGLPVTLYPKANCSVGTLQPVKGLTPMLTTLSTAVDTLQPSGATNITIGLQWGMETLTSSVPLVGSSSSSKKFMILMTDGMNTQDRWWGDGTATSPNRDKIDARTKLACDNAKKYGITLYTINLVNGDPNLLKYCASDAGKYFAVSDATQLTNVFLEIANMIKRIRLSK